ncbi:hypothetical protein BGX26_008133, partial [Mortierella sp. AD094]
QQQEQQEQQQPEMTKSKEAFLEIFLPYFQSNFARSDMGTTQTCVEFNTGSPWAIEILEASGCDTLQRLDLCHLDFSSFGSRQLSQKIKGIIHRNKNLRHLVLNIRYHSNETDHWNAKLETLSSEQSPASTSTPTSSALDTPLPPIPLSSSLKTITLVRSAPTFVSMMDIICLSPVLETFDIRHVWHRSTLNQFELSPTLSSLKSYKSSMRTFNIFFTDIHLPNWQLWPILYCSPHLKSIHWRHVRFMDPYPPVTQPQEEFPPEATTTAMPTLHPSLVRFEGLTSIIIELCTLEKEQLLYMLAACPNLQRLHLVDIYLRDQDIEKPFWFFPTSAATSSSSSSAFSPDQVNQQPVSPSDAYFKNLKCVVLMGLGGKYISAHEQVQFLRSLPALESIELGIGGNCSSYGSPRLQPEPSETAHIPDFQFEKVKKFDLTLKTALPRKLARIFGLLPPGKCTSLHFRTTEEYRLDLAEHTGGKFDLEWPGGLLLHKNTVQDVSIQGSEFSSLGPMLLEILQNFPRLKRLEVMDRASIALKCTADNLSVPWVCSELEVLDVFMDCTHSNGQADEVNKNLLGIDMVTPSFFQTQQVLFERLASLPNLRKLAICRGGGDIPSVDFSLKTGLGILSTLTKLEELDVRVIEVAGGESTMFLDDDVVYRVCENLSVEDAVWIVEHWQALKTVRGLQWNGYDGATTLKGMLTEQQRSDMVFEEY